MATFEIAYNWALDNEDSRRSYATVPDTGGEAISGVNSAAFPSWFALINSTPQFQRGPLVEKFYRDNFWNQWYELLNLDDIAKRVFDAAVNMGQVTAVKLLQKATGCSEDGRWGPNTVDAANAQGESLVGAFKEVRSDHYRDIVAAKPANQKYLAAWLARAEK